ncbi:DUF1707 domain-containing protein [Nocardioides sp. 1609]|uniref:DUF1707 SHOCT-like domain-containing protein n=1 Tax=Nocardioides sp. 1609 TaxID=2508327 RepID=UPI00106F85AC|nr:DUF1707 domain-containing protein [Nocardioides sp. 1609]
MNDGLRIGDTERDRAAADLSEHVALGRLSVDEHAERLDAVWSARTGADLEAVFHDLPSSTPARRVPGGSASGRRPDPGPWGPGRFRAPGGPGGRAPFVPILILLVVLSVVTQLPFWIGIVLLGCGLLAHRAHRGA